MPHIALPQKVSFIISRLNCAGYSAHAVGGCVRDSLLGRTPEDWDICTSCAPENTAKIFDGAKYMPDIPDIRVIPTGIAHGTVALLVGGELFEVTTYRCDGKYTDNRHPDRVEFVDDIAADLARRDFTVNAMAYNDRDGLTDIFGGQADLDNRILRAVGTASERFDEDALRIMRAIRFAAVLGFSIERETSAALVAQRELLCRIAAERISAELKKLILSAGSSRIISEYYEVIDTVLVRFGAKSGNIAHYNNAAKIIAQLPQQFALRLFALIDGCGRAESVCRTMKLCREDCECAAAAEKDILLCAPKNEVDARRMIRDIGFTRAENAMQYRICSGDTGCEAALALLQNQLECWHCFSVRELDISGDEVAAAGVNGRLIGVALNRLLDEVITGELPNRREALVCRMKSAGFIHRLSAL